MGARVPTHNLVLVCVCCRMMWAAGAVAAMSSITFPAVSALVSQSADPDKQGDKDNLLSSHTDYNPLASPFQLSLLFFLRSIGQCVIDVLAESWYYKTRQ